MGRCDPTLSTSTSQENCIPSSSCLLQKASGPLQHASCSGLLAVRRERVPVSTSRLRENRITQTSSPYQNRTVPSQSKPLSSTTLGQPGEEVSYAQTAVSEAVLDHIQKAVQSHLPCDDEQVAAECYTRCWSTRLSSRREVRRRVYCHTD